MPWIALIKTVDTPVKKVGDLVGVFVQGHVFSDIEHQQFNIREITGFTRQEILDWLNDNLPETRRIYRTPTGVNIWSHIIEKKEAWNDNGTWRFLENRPKFGWNFGAFTAQDALNMADPGFPKSMKLQLWEDKIEFRMQNLPENQTEVI